ncbi:MAG: tetratricopeptide repeat protein [Bacteroidales bacterium]|jgi:tetratricopeptide (TPR) repeat protein|nr:tetratricopeptide repeat protein [Bacteroidales bacterium]MDD3700578.1 tetratricopeptide repeat protein [Bacteroidales bacterium]MDY0368298.1 tetratricopeptide repeat protein [Bacteroidales bacterium]
MDFLRQTLFLSILFITFISRAQENAKLQQAFELSYIAEAKGDYNMAIHHLTSVYQTESYEINIRLGWLNYVSGRFTEALPYYQKCIALMPMSIEARLGFINPSAALGNWTAVEQQYLEILRLDPMNTIANYRMGLLNYGKDNYVEALKYFNKVLNLYPFDYDTVVMVGWSLYKIGKLREAKVMFQKTLLIKPNDSSALEGLSLIR